MRRSSVIVLSLLAALLAGPAVAQVVTKNDDAETRLKFALEALRQYTLTLQDGRETTVTVHEQPGLRWTNTISNTHDGIVGVYATPQGRPEAVVQFSLKAESTWIYEIASTSQYPFEMRRNDQTVWAPDAPGVELRPIPDAPAPADSPQRRLLQMRRLAERFEFEDDFHPQYSEPRTETHTLRLLTKPMYRYGRPQGEVIDGALFALVITTDPEALLMIEAHRTPDGPRWMYAYSPMTVYTLRAKLDSEAIWDRPEKRSWAFNEPYRVGLFR